MIAALRGGPTATDSAGDRSSEASTSTSTSSETFKRPEQRRVRLHPPVALLDDGPGGELTLRSDSDVEPDRVRDADQRQLALHVQRVPVRGDLHRRRPEGDLHAQEDLADDRLLDVRLVVVLERLHTARPVEHAQRCGVGVEDEARVRRAVPQLERRLPPGDAQEQVVAGLGGGPPTARPDEERRVLGPELVRTGRDRNARSLLNRFARLCARDGRRARPLLHHHEADRRELRRDPRLEPPRPVRRGRQRGRGDRSDLGSRADLHQDGRDVDDVQRHPRRRRAGRRRRITR